MYPSLFFQLPYSVLTFVLFWVALCTLTPWLAGWFALASSFPDRPETPRRVLGWQTARMGAWINFNNVLTLSVCPSGLRVSIPRLFGPFCRPFFVPWNAISIARRKTFFFTMVELSFGNPAVGRLVVRESVARAIANAAGTQWPAWNRQVIPP